jgi:hypothetical protein
MIVVTQKKGRSVTGLRVGTSNVRRYFRHGVAAIDLELDDLRIRCDLQASFWRDRPEIADRRLCDWLQNKYFREIPSRTHLSLELVGTGDSYRLTLPHTREGEPAGLGREADERRTSGELV